jgi:hypothetical protein
MRWLANQLIPTKKFRVPFRVLWIFYVLRGFEPVKAQSVKKNNPVWLFFSSAGASLSERKQHTKYA